MSFVINTRIDKNKEFLDALRHSWANELDKDVNLICKDNIAIKINSYVLALASGELKLSFVIDFKIIDNYFAIFRVFQHTFEEYCRKAGSYKHNCA